MTSIVEKYLNLSLIHVKRYSGSFLISPESVADHVSELVSLMLLMEDLFPVKFDSNKLLRKIVVHDMDEITGDIIRPFKYFRKDLTEVLKSSSLEYISSLGYSESLVNEIANDKDNTLEGYMLKYLDILQVVSKIHREVFQLGNKTLSNELNYATSHLYYVTEDILKCKFLTKDEIAPAYKFLTDLNLDVLGRTY